MLRVNQVGGIMMLAMAHLDAYGLHDTLGGGQ